MEETEHTRELTEEEIDDYNSFIEWNNLNDCGESMELFLKQKKDNFY